MKVLAILYPPRLDVYSYLLADKRMEYEVLWHENEQEFQRAGYQLPAGLSAQHFWLNFSTPKKLLKEIKPDRIVFMEIIDQRQIALIASAKKMGIPTFYLEHGSAGDRDTALRRQGYSESKRDAAAAFIKLFSSFSKVVKVKLFYYSNFNAFASPSNRCSYMKLPLLMLRHAPNQALCSCIFPERVPQKSIVFNRSNFREYQLYTGISENEAVFTGVPFFDNYYRKESLEKDHIIYIEHPMLESGLLEWDHEHHRKISGLLFGLAEERKIKIYVKLHPKSNISLWTHLMNRSEYFEVLQQGDYTDLYLSSRLIFGYSSSLLVGLLCAKKNIVNIGWHPVPQIFGSDFSKHGVCHKSMKPEDIHTELDNWMSSNLCLDNKTGYEKFIFEFNYPFDGRAAERVTECIVNA